MLVWLCLSSYSVFIVSRGHFLSCSIQKHLTESVSTVVPESTRLRPAPPGRWCKMLLKRPVQWATTPAPCLSQSQGSLGKEMETPPTFPSVFTQSPWDCTPHFPWDCTPSPGTAPLIFPGAVLCEIVSLGAVWGSRCSGSFSFLVAAPRLCSPQRLPQIPPLCLRPPAAPRRVPLATPHTPL